MLRYDIDLNNDGKKEVLLSMARDRNGKQGNVWSVFSSTPNGFALSGELTASPEGFYLGPIDEVHAFGIVTFWPGGGGSGVYTAYVFNGASIADHQLGTVDRNPQTLELEGNGVQMAAKYTISVADSLRDQVERLRADGAYAAPDPAHIVTHPTTISSNELSERYGVTVQGKTYQQALEEEISAPDTATMVEASQTPSTLPDLATSPGKSTSPASSAAPTTADKDSPSRCSALRMWAAVVAILAIISALVLVRRGKGR